MKQVTVRLGDELHRRVKVRAAQDGVAMEALGRRWFEEYAANGFPEPVFGVGEATGGLVAGEGASHSSPREDSRPVETGVPSSPAANPRKCSREARHHTNHGGKPCPECGWPA